MDATHHANSKAASRGQFIATVLSNTALCREHYRLVLRVENFPPAAPGQFVQVLCRDWAQQHDRDVDWSCDRRLDGWSDDLIGPTAFLRRPFSLAGYRSLGSAAEVDLIHRAVGVATHWLSQLQPGQSVGLIGPLGNTFTLPSLQQSAILVGGGVGIPPMLFLADRLQGVPAVAFCGALCRQLLPLTVRHSSPPPANDEFMPRMNIEEFSRHGIASVVSTDDGSYGFRGYITQALERYLDSQQVKNPVIYTCGPEAMMRRVADIALVRNLPCQVAAERAMACGMGTCQSCCIRVKKADPALPPLAGRDWCYRLTCTDGPVFAAADLLW